MYLDFSKNISKQLNYIFPLYSFNIDFEDSFRLNLISLFISKLRDNLIPIEDFCFYIKLNSPSLNNFKSIELTLLNRFKNDIINSFNPISFKIKPTQIELSSFENSFFNLAKLIEQTDEYKYFGFKDTSYNDWNNIRNLFFPSEERRFIHSYKVKKNTFKLSFYKMIPFSSPMSSLEIFNARYLFSLDYISSNILFIRLNTVLQDFFSDKKEHLYDYVISANYYHNTEVKIINSKTNEEFLFTFNDRNIVHYVNSYNDLLNQVKNTLLLTANILNIDTEDLL